jgi:hypothetical protein
VTSTLKSPGVTNQDDMVGVTNQDDMVAMLLSRETREACIEHIYIIPKFQSHTCMCFQAPSRIPPPPLRSVENKEQYTELTSTTGLSAPSKLDMILVLCVNKPKAYQDNKLRHAHTIQRI